MTILAYILSLLGVYPWPDEVIEYEPLSDIELFALKLQYRAAFGFASCGYDHPAS